MESKLIEAMIVQMPIDQFVVILDVVQMKKNKLSGRP
jgi:hypothetical protein